MGENLGDELKTGVNYSGMGDLYGAGALKKANSVLDEALALIRILSAQLRAARSRCAELEAKLAALENS